MQLTVRVSTKELTDRVAENRGDHRLAFEKALEGYREQAIAQLEDRLEAMRTGKDRVDIVVRLPRPEDHTEDYDRVLDMLSMHQDDEIEISDQEFAMYVRDDWDWKRQWVVSNSGYTTLTAGGKFDPPSR